MQPDSNLDYKRLFEATPTWYMVVNQDFTIAAVSDSFLTGTHTRRQHIIGKKVEKVFPDNPADVDSKNASYLRQLIEQVFEYGEPVEVEMLKYDIPHPAGGFEERFWHNINIPIRNDGRQIKWVLHVTEDITESVRHKQNEILWLNQLTESNEEAQDLRELYKHLSRAREEERARIAREIHDSLGQQLTVIKMDMNWLGKRLNNQPPIIHNKIEGIITLLSEMVRSVRRIATELRPSLLDDMGLVAAVEWQLNEIAERTGIKIHLTGLADEPVMNPDRKLNLFRILQEAITNVIRHAQARNVWVSFLQNDGLLQLEVRDDGVGLVTGKPEKIKFGLLSMKERTLMLGGHYQIHSSAEGGTTINIVVKTL